MTEERAAGDRIGELGFGSRRRPDEVVPGFFDAQRRAHRHSVILLIGVGIVLTLVVNLLMAPLHTEEVCELDAACEREYDARIGLYVLSVVAVVAYLLLAPRIALWLARRTQDEVAGAPAVQLANVVEEMSIAAGTPPPRSVVIDDPALNAFAIPAGANGTIAVTSGAVEQLNRRELGGVIAHEIGHLRNRDSQVVLVATVTVAFIDHVRRIAAAIGTGAMVAAGRTRGGKSGWLVSMTAFAIAAVAWFVAIVVGLIALPAALMLRAGLSRQREKLADAAAVQYTRDPGALRMALERLADCDVAPRHDNTVNHSLWIDSPARSGSDDWFQKLYASHPPMKDRIEWLRALEGAMAAGDP